MKYSGIKERKKKGVGRGGEGGQGFEKEKRKKKKRKERGNIPPPFHIMIDGVWANCICNNN